MTYAKRKDANHNAIAEAFEQCGFSVFDTSALPKFVDMVVYRRINGTLLIEVKDGTKPPSRTRLRDTQVELAKKFPVVVVHRVEDVVELANGSAFDIPRIDIAR